MTLPQRQARGKENLAREARQTSRRASDGQWIAASEGKKGTAHLRRAKIVPRPVKTARHPETTASDLLAARAVPAVRMDLARDSAPVAADRAAVDQEIEAREIEVQAIVVRVTAEAFPAWEAWDQGGVFLAALA